jgi:D-alanyl-D-alanine carboxypeptidase (penicillin-binding protein 5/6)
VAAALLAALSIGLIGAATADTIGGDRLASTHRTVSLQAGAQRLPDVWADSWILADATTGEVLAQKGSHVRRAPASTLKMLTALAVMPNTTPEQQYVATSKAANTYGARVGLHVGRTYTLDELWYAVFLPSANDAAIAVAQANGGVRHTVGQMNGIAEDLHALDTHARNTNGLDSPGQTSSAYDLALFARAGMQRPDFARYAGTARAEFPNMTGKGRHPIYTTNRLLLHGFHGITGVKTGFTTQAGRTYVGAASRRGTNLIVALMGIHESSEIAARDLLEWGFANHDKVTPIGTLVSPGDPAATDTSAASGESSASGAADSGSDVTSTQAASPTAGPGPAQPAKLPWLAALAAAMIAVTSAVIVLTRRRSRSAGGRHAA